MTETDIDKDSYGPFVVAGCGYTGTRIAAKLASGRSRVFTLTANSRVPLQDVESAHIDLDASQPPVVLTEDSASVIYLVPPPSQGVKDTRIRNFLMNVIGKVPRKFVLISTTGVYGDSQGAWVDENAPVNPRTDRARRRLDSELFTTDWARQNHVNLVILRVGAIYGPDRVPLERLRQGITLPPASSSGFLNRVHVDDLTAICVAAMRSNAEGIFNVSDGQPLKMIEYMNLVAEIFGLPKVFESSNPSDLESHSSSLRQYLGESRKIDNRRVLHEFSIELRYPTARQGLEASFREMADSKHSRQNSQHDSTRR